MTTKLPLILPVETHVRELDGKLLLAAVGAERGRACYVGSQNEIRARIGQLPRGHFVAKGFASGKARFLSIVKQLGHSLLAWDEEGLVHPEPEIYYRRRISPQSLAFLDGVFSWGPEYTELFRNNPYFDGTPVHLTGNPRIDLLDRRVRDYFSAAAQRIRLAHGSFILLNSNFGRVNPLIERTRDKDTAIRRLAPEIDSKWQAFVEYRRQIYAKFRLMFREVCRAFPDRMVILRPHPSEQIESWDDIAREFSNARIIYEGNATPWLLAAEILVHNGCTTAIESALLERPVIAYMPQFSERFDRALPLGVSHRASSIDELIKLLEGHLGQGPRLTVTAPQRASLDPFVYSSEDQLACDNILDVVESLDGACQQQPSALRLALGKTRAGLRATEKKLRSLLPRDIYSPWHQDKHFPDFSLPDMAERLLRLQKATGRFAAVSIDKPHDKIFRLAPGK